jgi:hypothetical protein
MEENLIGIPADVKDAEIARVTEQLRLCQLDNNLCRLHIIDLQEIIADRHLLPKASIGRVERSNRDRVITQSIALRGCLPGKSLVQHQTFEPH